MPVAEFNNLTVRYGNFTALDSFSVSIPEGCVGLLGPNGAGKTTLLKAILGFISPTDGTGHVLGLDIAKQGNEIRQKIGYMPEQDCHIPGMSAVQYVALAGELAGLPHNHSIRRAHEVLEYCGLGEARYRKVETYSTGMKQRIKLAQALVHGPSLLLLDEPTNGLDPRGRDSMLELVIDLAKNKGVNTLVCSHLLPDIERTCEEVVVLLAGKLRAEGTVRDLKSIPGQPMDVELRLENDAFTQAASALELELLQSEGYRYRLQGPGDVPDTSRRILQAARNSDSQVRFLALAQRSLEEAFLEAVDE